jgi:subtilisin-like proprotein convertase family protein
MRKVVTNNTPVNIPADAPTQVTSPIDIAGVAGPIADLSLTLTLFHTFTSDLRISLMAPSGQEVLLVGGAGGNGDNLINTTFDDGAPTMVSTAAPPFTGTFRPEGNLSSFNGLAPNGEWTLRIADTASLDGGVLTRWSLALTLAETTASEFTINVRFLAWAIPSTTPPPTPMFSPLP